MNNFLRKKKLVRVLATVSLSAVFFSGTMGYAADFSSSNFIIRNPVLGQSGGNSSSSGYKNEGGSLGQFVIGQDTSLSFKLDSGWVYGLIQTVAATVNGLGGAALPTGEGPTSGGSSSAGSSASPITSTPTVDKKAGVKFIGKTFPSAKVFLLKDGKSQGGFMADAKGDFVISLVDLTSGSFNFVLYTQDLKGNKSKNFSRDVDTISGKTVVVENIVFEPTVYLNKNEVKRGYGIAISGQAVFDDYITAVIGENFVSIDVKIAENGSYFYDFETTSLDFGKYNVYVKMRDGLQSNVVSFIVGEENVLAVSVEELSGDINAGGKGDGAIDLVDFSILAYWYGKKLTDDVKKIVDLTGDGVVDLKDFSILAANWTG